MKPPYGALVPVRGLPCRPCADLLGVKRRLLEGPINDYQGGPMKPGILFSNLLLAVVVLLNSVDRLCPRG